MWLVRRYLLDNRWKVSGLRALGCDKIGFVFQSAYLIPFLNVTDNVALLPMLAGFLNAESRAKALALLTALDVQHRACAMPAQLSGGEQLRVAIARGLVNRPPVILADEPIAPLDSERAMTVIRILNEMARQYETANSRTCSRPSLRRRGLRRFCVAEWVLVKKTPCRINWHLRKHRSGLNPPTAGRLRLQSLSR